MGLLRTIRDINKKQSFPDILIEYLVYFYLLSVFFHTRYIFPSVYTSDFLRHSLYFFDVLFLLIVLVIVFSGKVRYFFKLRTKVDVLLYTLFLIVFVLNIYQFSFLYVYKIFLFAEAVFIFFIISRLKKFSVKMFFYIFVFAMGINASVGLAQFFAQDFIFSTKWLGVAWQDAYQSGVSVVQSETGRWLRAYGLQPHPNILSGILVQAIVAGFYLFSLCSGKLCRIFFSVLNMVLVGGFLVSFSRAGFLAFLFLVFLMGFYYYFVLDYDKTKAILKKYFLYFVSVFSVLAGFLFYLYDIFKIRLAGYGRLEYMSVSDRVSLYDVFWNLFSNNFLGVGFGGFSDFYMRSFPKLPEYMYQPVHNTYLLILTELGVFGFFVFIVLIFYLLYNLKKIRDKKGVSDVLVFMLVPVFIISFFDHYYWSIPSSFLLVWIVLSLINRKICHK